MSPYPNSIATLQRTFKRERHIKNKTIIVHDSNAMKSVASYLALILAAALLGSPVHGNVACDSQNVTLASNKTYVLSNCSNVPMVRVRFVDNVSQNLDFVTIEVSHSDVNLQVNLEGVQNVSHLAIVLQHLRVTGATEPTLQLEGVVGKHWSITMENVTFTNCSFSSSWIVVSPALLWDFYIQLTNLTLTGSIQQSLIDVRPTVSMRNVTVRADHVSIAVHTIDSRLSLFRFGVAIEASDIHFVGNHVVAVMRLCGLSQLTCTYGDSAEPFALVWFHVLDVGFLSKSSAVLLNSCVDSEFVTPHNSIRGTYFYIVYIATAAVPSDKAPTAAVRGVYISIQNLEANVTSGMTTSIVFLDGGVAIAGITCQTENATVMLRARGAMNWRASGRIATLFAAYARMPAVVDTIIVARNVSGSFVVVGGCEVGTNASLRDIGKPSLIGCAAVSLTVLAVENVTIDVSGVHLAFDVTYGSAFPQMNDRTPTSVVGTLLQMSLVFISAQNTNRFISVTVEDSSFEASLNTSVAPSGGPGSPAPSAGTVTVTVTAVSLSLSVMNVNVTLRNTSFLVQSVNIQVPSAAVSVVAHALLLSCQLDFLFAIIVFITQISDARFLVADSQMHTSSVPLLQDRAAVYGPPTTTSTDVSITVKNVTTNVAVSLFLCYVSCSMTSHRVTASTLSNISSMVRTEAYGIQSVLVSPAVATFGPLSSITVAGSRFSATANTTLCAALSRSTISFTAQSVLQLSGNEFSGFTTLFPIAASSSTAATVSFLGILQLGCNTWNGLPMPSEVTKNAIAAVPSRRVLRMFALPGNPSGCQATLSRSLTPTSSNVLIPPIPPVPLPKATAEVGTTTTAAAAVGGATAVLGGGGAVVAALDAQMLASFGQSACSPASLKSSTGASQFLVSPFFLYGPVWSVVGNLCLVMVLAAAHAGGTMVIANKSATGAVTSKSKQFRAAGATSRFPNLTIDVTFLLLGGVANFGSRMLFQNEALHIAMGILSLAAITVVFVGLFRLAQTSSVSKMRFEWYLQRVRRATPAPCWMLPVGRWGPDDLRNSHGRLRMLVHPDGTTLSLYPQVASLVAQFLSGLPVPNTGAWCPVIMSLLAVNSSTLVGLLLWRRPERIPFTGALNMATHILLVALYVVSAFSAADGSRQSSDSAAAVLYLSLAMTGVSVTKAIHAVLVGRWEAKRTAHDVAIDSHPSASPHARSKRADGQASSFGGDGASFSKDGTSSVDAARLRFPGEVELEDVLLKPHELAKPTSTPAADVGRIESGDFRPSRRPPPQRATQAALLLLDAVPADAPPQDADVVAALVEEGYSRRKAKQPPNQTAVIAALEKLVGMAAARAGASRKKRPQLHAQSPHFPRSFFASTTASENS